MRDHIIWNNAHNVRIEVPLASIGMRILAFLLDGLVKGLFIVFIIFLFSKVFTNFPGIGLIIVLLSPYIFYSFLFESLNDGQSPGKRICSIKVTSMNGQAAGAQSYFLRWIFRLIDFQLISQLVALISAAMSENRQRIGDMVANTVVVNTKVVQRAMYEAYTSIPEAYKPLHPEAKKLAREDIVLIKEIMKKEMGPARDALVIKMHRKLVDTYGITSKEPPRRLLYSLVKDYNYYQLKGDDNIN